MINRLIGSAILTSRHATSTTTSLSLPHVETNARTVLSIPTLTKNRLLSEIRRLSSSAPNPVEYLCVHVFVSVKPGTEDDFIKASLANARASAQEEGVARFDVIQEEDDPTKFVLVEVYKTSEAPAAHKETQHYLTWRSTVEDMMAQPRKAIKYRNKFPALPGGWDYGKGVPLE
ncbi:hypothetical protein ACHAXS_006994 [Conticribra weissflogii]